MVKQKTDTETLLGELYKEMKMGADSLTDILSRVKDGDLRTELTRQIEEYAAFAKTASDRLYDCGIKPQEEGIMARMSAKLGMAMNTMTDSTTSHLAQMVIEGDTMGITELTRLVREHENTACSEATLALVRDAIRFLEDAVERTKEYL